MVTSYYSYFLHSKCFLKIISLGAKVTHTVGLGLRLGDQGVSVQHCFPNHGISSISDWGVKLISPIKFHG
jgi:hypothetical protein